MELLPCEIPRLRGSMLHSWYWKVVLDVEHERYDESFAIVRCVQ
jgi:hypothetical protein